jgi:spermidine synthase
MFHGSILHGVQFTAADRRRIPTTYYGEQSGAGLALRFHHPDASRHVGVVGLGVGTLAAYGQRTDRFRFYEINPDVIALAEKYFTYLSDSPAKSMTVLGDARLSLEQETPNQFDVLVLDAFSGDAIPTHLLTREAGQLYAKHLKPDGILCIHISNLHFDLRPVVQGLARDLQLKVTCVEAPQDDSSGTTSCHWMLLSRGSLSPELLNGAYEIEGLPPKSLLWTDEWSNLLSVLR